MCTFYFTSAWILKIDTVLGFFACIFFFTYVTQNRYDFISWWLTHTWSSTEEYLEYQRPVNIQIFMLGRTWATRVTFRQPQTKNVRMCLQIQFNWRFRFVPLSRWKNCPTSQKIDLFLMHLCSPVWFQIPKLCSNTIYVTTTENVHMSILYSSSLHLSKEINKYCMYFICTNHGNGICFLQC